MCHGPRNVGTELWKTLFSTITPKLFILKPSFARRVAFIERTLSIFFWTTLIFILRSRKCIRSRNQYTNIVGLSTTSLSCNDEQTNDTIIFFSKQNGYPSTQLLLFLYLDSESAKILINSND